MNFSRETSERWKIVWPTALAVTVAWCSGHELPHWAQPTLGEDKIEHLLVFGLMATLLARLESVQRTRPFGIYAAAIAVSVFGLTDELHQHFTPGRAMDAWDWIADTSGAVLATLLYAHWHGYRRLLEMRVGSLWAGRKAPESVAMPEGLLPRAA